MVFRTIFRSQKDGVLKTVSSCGLALLTGCTVFCSYSNAQQARPAVSPAAAAAQQNKVKTVAVVNRQPISRIRLGNLCIERFGKEVLEAMVNRLLVEKECERLGIQITAKDISTEINRVAKNSGITAQQYIQLISERRGVSEDKFRNEITWLSLALRNIAAKSIQISEEEVDKGLSRRFGSKVLLRMIVADNIEDATAYHQAVTKDPESFGRVAKDFSKDPGTAPYAGLSRVPYREGELGPEIDRVIFSLKKGEISKIVKSHGRYFIYRCNTIFPPVSITREQQEFASHSIRDEIRERKLRTVGPKVYRDLQNRAKIQIVHGNKNLANKYPGIAAIVDNTPIKMSGLAEECISRSGTQVLQVEIARTILQQETKQRNIVVTQSDLHAEIDRAAEEAGFVDVGGKVKRNEWLNRVTENDPSKISTYIDDAVWLSCALRKLVVKNVDVSAEDMQKAFVANYGPRVKVLAIVFTDHRSAEKVWRMARTNPTEENFRKLAETYSAEMTSRYNQGTVPPIARFSGRPQLEEAAFGLKENEMSGIFAEGKNWMFLYCKGRTTPYVKEMKDVRDILYKQLLERKIVSAANEQMIDLHRSAEIDNFLSPKSQIGKQAMDSFKRNQKRTQR